MILLMLHIATNMLDLLLMSCSVFDSLNLNLKFGLLTRDKGWPLQVSSCFVNPDERGHWLD